MSRLRYNGLVATLAAPGLTNSATTINFAAALTYNGGTAVPTITGSDYIPLTILDLTGVPKEIVWLTAYTSGATSGTITRAQEGTSGVAHVAGLIIVNAATVLDLTIPPSGAYAHPIDDPTNWPATVGIPDTEFDAGTFAAPVTSLPSGWTWANQGTSTYSESLGAGLLTAQHGANSINLRTIRRSLSGAPSTWDLYAKFEPALDPDTQYDWAGMVFRENSTDKARMLGVHVDGLGYMRLAVTSFSSNTAASYAYGPAVTAPTFQYWRIRKNSSTDYGFYGSRDGKQWYPILLAHNPAFTPDEIGWAVAKYSTADRGAAIQWMRLR